ncbi:MAG TPA: hypothetical protein VFS77_08905 [Pyrinomonadaceae bacterium]|nr:hypothetical protein [Pyrinomonadaceae bacterium]
MVKKTDASDPRFHYEIWKGPSAQFGNRARSICYVENHNAPCGYAELALDFQIATEALLAQYRATGYGNWTAPVAHMSRQLTELLLKALMTAITWRTSTFDATPLGSHNLQSIWLACRVWLVANGYRVLEDARLEDAEHLIQAFHEIDPSGDLFRFGVSKKTAFEKQKSYDRVGIEIDHFENELRAVHGLLQHWEAVLVREDIKREMGWDQDPMFDANDFPKKPK